MSYEVNTDNFDSLLNFFYDCLYGNTKYENILVDDIKKLDINRFKLFDYDLDQIFLNAESNGYWYYN